MKKYPFVKQEGIKDCGCTCLLMIIKYYKGYIPLEELREITKTTKLGTDAYHLGEAAKEIGFHVRALKTDLNKELLLPAIVHVTMKNGLNHYMVLYKINFKKKYVIVGDPAIGIYKMKWEQFEEIWNHIFLELVPIRSIPIHNDISLKEFIVGYLKPYRKTLLVLFISSFLISLFSSILSLYFRIMIDSIYTSKFFLTQLLLIFVFIFVFKIIMDFLRNKIFVRFNQSIDMNISCDIFEKIIDLPYQYYRNRTTGEIISRFDDLERVRQMLQQVIFTLFSDIPLIIVSFIFLFFIDISLTIIVISILFLYFISFIVFKSIFNKYIIQMQEQNAITTSFITESLTGIETINNCRLKNLIKEKFSSKYYYLLGIYYRFSNWINSRYVLTESVYQIGILVLLFLGTIKVYDKNLSVGSLIMFYSIFLSFLEPLKNIIQMDLNWKESCNALKRMLSIFIPNKNDGIVSEIECYDIKCNKLTFYYNDIDLVLKNINLNIKSGEKVLITGKSGSGKSTLLKILRKYYDVCNEQVFIDNIDINYCKQDLISKKIGYLSSNEWLFTGSIMDNLGELQTEQMLEMINICEVDKLMKKRGLNLHSILEENGFNLSGGERQRIALARFLLQDFDILLIDEGLNQMDINLERRILKKIFERYRDKTIIVVSHRLDNIDLFGRVIEIEKGQIRKDVVRNA